MSSGRFFVIFMAGLFFGGCSDKKAPPGMSLIRVHGAAADETSRERLGIASREWDLQGWMAHRADVEVREPDPHSLPPFCYGCDPHIVINGQQGIAFTFPQQASIVITRGEEWSLVHEFLHLQHQVEGRAPDVHHSDERWKVIDAVAKALRERMK